MIMDLTRKVLEVVLLDDGSFKLTIDEPGSSRAGQFYMLRVEGASPLLPRPISVHWCDGRSTSFLIREVGAATAIMRSLRVGDSIEARGPLGTSYPELSGRVALVGGGTGIAPMLLASREIVSRGGTADVYLGFSRAPICEDDYRREASSLTIDIGGYITDAVDPSKYDAVISCGPDPMQRALHAKCAAAGVELWASFESRMACGYGVCLGCSCDTASGRKRICKDGPVFRSSEIYGR